MRSGNGRHRRPRQAPAFVVTAGVAGAGMALPLFAASAAHAADSGTWDRVAQCESGGTWSANSGNGYYGGLQLTLQSWKSYGGTEYAARPDLASRSEQIAVAEKILDALGPDAWPNCSMSAGLTGESTEAPDVDPGVPDDDLLGGLLDPPADTSTDTPTDTPTDDPSPSAGDGTSTPAPSPSPSTPAESPTPDAPSDTADEPAGPDATDAGGGTADATDPPADESGTDAAEGGRHRGAHDTRGDHDEESGRSSRSGHGRHGRAADADGEHLVRPGDTLSAIAAENHVDGGWHALYETNRETVGDDPDLILPGQLLHW
ncbi:MAG TPA: transglycosylase family protein [Streptomyces sp.]|jgi:hypothetical protein|nr:transglycosylase family protein [Streptomyces sp.]